YATGAEPFADVLGGARGAVDGADDGEVVAGAVAAVATVVALEVARLGRRRGRWAVTAEGVVALEGVGPDVVDVDVPAGRAVGRGEADHLAVLEDRLPGGDGPHGELVPEAEAGR